MPKGTQKKLDEFDTEANALHAARCRFRMVRRERNYVIRVLDYKPVWDKERKTPLEFGTEFVHKNDLGWMTKAEIAQIQACAELCKKSHAEGRWLGTTYDERRNNISPNLPTDGAINWPVFASRIERYINQGSSKVSTKKNYLSFLNGKKGLKTWTGAVTSTKIVKWLEKSDRIG